MSGKQDKKIRKYFRQEYQAKADELARLHGNWLKPKPKWVPMPVWLWAMGFFVKIKKRHD